MPAITVDEINALLAYSVGPLDETDTDARAPTAIIAGRAEVSEGAIQYGDVDHDAVNARLAELGIIVRQAVIAAP